jgi:hypothetical protein
VAERVPPLSLRAMTKGRRLRSAALFVAATRGFRTHEGGAALPDDPHGSAAHPAEGGVAELTARGRGQETVHPALPEKEAPLPGEKRLPFRVLVLVLHAHLPVSAGDSGVERGGRGPAASGRGYSPT